MGKHKGKKNSPKRRLLALEEKYPQAFEILIFVSRASLPVVLPDEVYICWKEFGIAIPHPKKKGCYLVDTEYIEYIREGLNETEEDLLLFIDRAWQEEYESTLELYNSIWHGAEISKQTGIDMQFFHLVYKMDGSYYPHALLSKIMTEQRKKTD